MILLEFLKNINLVSLKLIKSSFNVQENFNLYFKNLNKLVVNISKFYQKSLLIKMLNDNSQLINIEISIERRVDSHTINLFILPAMKNLHNLEYLLLYGIKVNIFLELEDLTHIIFQNRSTLISLSLSFHVNNVLRSISKNDIELSKYFESSLFQLKNTSFKISTLIIRIINEETEVLSFLSNISKFLIEYFRIVSENVENISLEQNSNESCNIYNFKVIDFLNCLNCDKLKNFKLSLSIQEEFTNSQFDQFCSILEKSINIVINKSKRIKFN